MTMASAGGHTTLLRVSTAGSVDDGKSTLIGRLLYDAKGIFEDQLAHVEEASRRRGFDRTELALLTDGLRAEREQGITIDVAYRYFATPRRKFILADTPGHVQYTRNMVTGASTADVAVILLDARHGVVEQSRRHAAIATLLGIPHLVVAVNKMDLVGWSYERFAAIRAEFDALATRVGARSVRYIPLSALHGDNVVDLSTKAPWYDGPPLLEHLETVRVDGARDLVHPRFAVQWVVRPQSDAFHDYRGYAGQVAGGVFRPGDEVLVLPAGLRTRVLGIDGPQGALERAYAPLSVTLRLADDVDVSRGDLIVGVSDAPVVSNTLRATVCWMAQRPLSPRSTLAIKHTTRWARAVVTGLESRFDVTTLDAQPDPARLELNDIATVTLKTTAPLAFDPYAVNRVTGSFILVDEATNATVGAGMIQGAVAG